MGDNSLQLLTARIGEQYFGLDIGQTGAIMLRDTCTVIPRSPAAVTGVINLRGQVVTLINIKACLDMNGDDNARMTITYEYNGEIYGLLFDAVEDIITIDKDDLEPVPEILDERWSGMASAILRQEKRLVIRLDPAGIIRAVLEDSEDRDAI